MLVLLKASVLTLSCCARLESECCGYHRRARSHVQATFCALLGLTAEHEGTQWQPVDGNHRGCVSEQMNSARQVVSSSGVSSLGRCPQPGSTTRELPGTFLTSSAVADTTRSCAPARSAHAKALQLRHQVLLREPEPAVAN